MRVGRWSALAAVVAVCVGTLSAWGQTQPRTRIRSGPRGGPATQPAPETQPAPPTPPSPTPMPPRNPVVTVPTQPTAPPRLGPERPLVELEIECGGQPWGSIVLELFPERTPTTVRNFLQYVDDGFYDGTIFHRVLPDFLIQGGSRTSLTDTKTEGLRGPIRNESRNAPKNTRGAVAMARLRDPHSAVGEFFINVVDNERLDYPRAGSYGYCAFGSVVSGMEIVDRIKSAPTQISPEAAARFARYQAEGKEVEKVERSQPMNPPVIKKAHRLERAEYERRMQAAAAAESAGVPRPITPPTSAVSPPPASNPAQSPESAPEEEPPQ